MRNRKFPNLSSRINLSGVPWQLTKGEASMNRNLLLLSIIFLSLASPVVTFGGSWELYDDFSSGVLEAQKWNNTSTVSTVTVENQKVKIVHLAGNPEKSGYLNLVQNQENILGIRAEITIGSCIGDVRTRIAGHGGEIGENHVFTSVQLQPGQERIFTYSSIEGPPPHYSFIKDLHYGQFKRPLTLTGNTYTTSISFSNDGISYEVEGLGQIVYKYNEPVDATTNNWRAIGTRSTNGNGPCTVYIDDVYVLRP
jgi:hypothetical protein